MSIAIRPADALYEHEHELFRESFRAFLAQEVVPHLTDTFWRARDAERTISRLISRGARRR